MHFRSPAVLAGLGVNDEESLVQLSDQRKGRF